MGAWSRSSRALKRSFAGGIVSGFSLVELLIALVVAFVVLAAAGSMLLFFLKNSKLQERAQALREYSNRLNYLIQTEASEAKQVLYDEPPASGSGEYPSSCSYVSGTDLPLFRLVIPETVGEYGTSGYAAEVFYYQKSGDIRRCGPNTKQNGELVHGAIVSGSYDPPDYTDGVVMSSTSLAVVKDVRAECGVDVSSDKKIVFIATFASAPIKSECVVARVKTVYVCNPPTSEMQDLKDPSKTTYDPGYEYPPGTC